MKEEAGKQGLYLRPLVSVPAMEIFPLTYQKDLLGVLNCQNALVLPSWTVLFWRQVNP